MKTSWRYLCKMSWRCLEDVFKTSWRRLEDVVKTSEDVLARRLEDLLKRSWRRLEDVWPRPIYWSWSRRIEDVLKTSSEHVWVRWIYSSWSRRLEDDFKTSSEDEDERRPQDVFETSSPRRMLAGNVVCLLRCCSNWDWDESRTCTKKQT